MSFLFSQPKGVVKTPYYPRGKLRLLERPSPVSYLSTLTEAHSLPRIWDHQSVSYVPDTGSFWQCRYLSSSRLLLEFIWSDQKFNSLLRGIKSGPWVGSNPRPYKQVEISEFNKMENVAQAISKLIGSNSTQKQQAKQQIDTCMSTNPRHLLLKLRRICLDSSANEKVVAKAAELIRQRFLR